MTFGRARRRFRKRLDANARLRTDSRRHEAERPVQSPSSPSARLAAYLAVSDRTIRNWIRRGELPSYKLGAVAADRPRRRRGLPRPPPGRGGMRRESPIKRRNPSGQVVWVARYTGRDGKHHIAKPTLEPRQGHLHAQGRSADERSTRPTGSPIAPTPSATTSPPGPSATRRSERTNATNEHRICRVADVEVEGIALKDWPLRELRRRHALALVDHMLTTEGRATTGRGRHPPLPLGDGRGRDHRRSLRPQPVQGHPHPRQRPEGEEEAPPDPRLQLRGDARASPRRPVATRRWSGPSPTPA